ncbi:RICIN domain-containing protein [Streptosporangium sp. NPDC049644]
MGGSSATSRRVDVTGNTSADGTRLQLWDCAGGANQKWTIS